MPRNHLAHQALIRALRAIIALAPDQEPNAADYEADGQYAYGHDMGAWEAAELARAALRRAGIKET